MVFLSLEPAAWYWMGCSEQSGEGGGGCHLESLISEVIFWKLIGIIQPLPALTNWLIQTTTLLVFVQFLFVGQVIIVCKDQKKNKFVCQKYPASKLLFPTHWYQIIIDWFNKSSDYLLLLWKVPYSMWRKRNTHTHTLEYYSALK